jgi:uncharacterized protein
MNSRYEHRIFFASDLHGSQLCFQKFVAAARFYGASTLFLGGDIVGKRLLLIRKRGSGSYEAISGGGVVILSTSEDLRAFEKKQADAGVYTVVVDDAANITQSKCMELMGKAASRRLQSWLELAHDKLAPAGVDIIAIPGNDDPPFVDELLRDNGVMINADQRLVKVRDHLQVAGLGCSTPTPWDTYREKSDGEIADLLATTLEGVDPHLPLIFHVHVPPFGSGLDSCPVLDEELRPVIGSGGPLIAPVGSKAVYKAIQEYLPVLGLFGHIHEARGCIKIKKTLCANPGSEFAQGKLMGFLAAIKGNKVSDWLLTEG